MKKLVLLSFALLLFGCGGDEEGDIKTQPGQHQFKIAEDIFSVHIPDGWRTMKPPQDSETVYIAYHRHKNFVFLQKNGTHQETLIEELKTAAEKEFFVFQNFSADPENFRWSFAGKTSPSEPLRQYEQKVIFLAESDHYLLGSCAFEAHRSDKGACKKIISQWEKEVKSE